MENQGEDVSIEEMIEKLHKDCQEEMAVVMENRRKLERVGSCLAQVNQEGVASKTQFHAKGTDESWQYLLDLNGARVTRLKETLVAVQQLEKNMSNLQSWLAHIETKLSAPITYNTCDSQEIQRMLNQQQLHLTEDVRKRCKDGGIEATCITQMESPCSVKRQFK